MLEMKNVFIVLIIIVNVLFLSSCVNNSLDTEGDNHILECISKIKFNDSKVSYDGNAHSIYIEGEVPEGITVVYENNEQTKAGVYNVTATFVSDLGLNLEFPVLEATLTIVKDGQYHDLTVIYDNDNSETNVVENGYMLESLPIYEKEGYTSYYIDVDTEEVITFPYDITKDTTIEFVEIANTYKVNYYFNDELLFSDEVAYNSQYTLKEKYIND